MFLQDKCTNVGAFFPVRRHGSMHKLVVRFEVIFDANAVCSDSADDYNNGDEDGDEDFFPRNVASKTIKG